MSRGFELAGFKVLFAVDHWQPAVDVYKLNFNHPIENLDLSNVAESITQLKEFDPDLIIGGPPCQDFSSAGKRDETLGRADLTLSFAEIVVGLKPKYFVMENVARALTSKAFNRAYAIFQESGYGLTKIVLDASYYNVPQKRKRLFLIGELAGNNDALLPYLAKVQSSKPMTVRDFFGTSLGVEHYYRHPRSYQRRGIFSIDEPSPTIRGVNRPIPSGYKGHPGDTASINDNVRPLTTIERSLIQTFPSDFKWEGSKTNLELMIGNAVPVKLGQYVATCIKEYEFDKEKNRTLLPEPQPVQLNIFDSAYASA